MRGLTKSAILMIFLVVTLVGTYATHPANSVISSNIEINFTHAYQGLPVDIFLIDIDNLADSNRIVNMDILVNNMTFPSDNSSIDVYVLKEFTRTSVRVNETLNETCFANSTCMNETIFNYYLENESYWAWEDFHESFFTKNSTSSKHNFGSLLLPKNEIKHFKVVWNHAYGDTETGWGGSAIMSIIIDNTYTFVDLTNSSWYNTSIGIKQSLGGYTGEGISITTTFPITYTINSTQVTHCQASVPATWGTIGYLYYNDETDQLFTNPIQEAQIACVSESGNLTTFGNPFNDTIIAYLMNETDAGQPDTGDFSGNGANGTLVNGAFAVANDGITGHGVNFTDANHYIDIPAMGGNTSLEVTGTYLWWWRPEYDCTGASCNGDRFWRDADGHEDVFIDNGPIEAQSVCGSGVHLNSLTTTFTGGSWYMFAIPWNETNVELYINGTVENNTCTRNPAAWIAPDPDGADFGNRDPQGGIEGTVDNVIAYNRMLSAEEIAFLYNVTVGAINMTELGEKENQNASNTAPTVDSVQLSPTISTTSTNLECDVTVSDAEADALSVHIDWYKDGANQTGEHFWNYSIANGTATNYTLDSTNTSRAEVWICGVAVTDQTETTAITNSSPLTIANTLPTAPLVLTPNNVYYTNNTATINITWTESTDPDTNENFTYNITLRNTDSSFNTSINNTLLNGTADYNWNMSDLNLQDETYYVRIEANDSTGTGTSDENDFTLDTTLPAITIIHPQSTLSHTTFNLSFSVVDTNLDQCWYTNASNDNITLTNCNNVTISDFTNNSVNTIIVYANDSANLIGSDSQSFTIDTEQPTIGTVTDSGDCRQIDNYVSFASAISDNFQVANISCTFTYPNTSTAQVVPSSTTGNGTVSCTFLPQTAGANWSIQFNAWDNATATNDTGDNCRNDGCNDSAVYNSSVRGNLKSRAYSFDVIAECSSGTGGSSGGGGTSGVVEVPPTPPFEGFPVETPAEPDLPKGLNSTHIIILIAYFGLMAVTYRKSGNRLSNKNKITFIILGVIVFAIIYSTIDPSAINNTMESIKWKVNTTDVG